MILLAAITAALPARAAGPPPGAPAGTDPPHAADPLRVEIVTVEETPFSMNIVLTGTIEARDSLNAGFRQGGRVTEMLVNAGDRVTPGQPLARTDADQQDQARQVAQAALDSALAARDQAALAADRAVALLDRGVGTRAARDAAAQSLSAAEGAVVQARSALDRAQRALDDTVLRAPTAAVVTARMAEPGQVVAPAQGVVSLAMLAGLEAVFRAPNSALLENAVGTQIALTPLEIPGREMTANVVEVAPLVDPSTGSVEIRARIADAPTDAALLGAAVRGEISVPAGRGMAVPWTALTAMGDSPAVWVVAEDGTVDAAPVVICRFQNETVLIDTGLVPGQRVVGAGSQMLFPGRRVVDAAAP
nr:efflux RND transporter periplasmic adaptor subunit [Paracoccus sp. Z118]